MSDRPPFDPIKASFYLVAMVIGVQCIVVLAGVAFCFDWARAIVEGRYKCDPDGRLGELLALALATAVAFAGGFTRK